MINEEYDEDNENHRIAEREYFEKNLRVKHGLKTETASSTRNKETTHFVKISAPWRVLSKYAEILKFRMPIKVFGKYVTDKVRRCPKYNQFVLVRQNEHAWL